MCWLWHEESFTALCGLLAATDGFLLSGAQTQYLTAHGLRSPAACGVLVPGLGIKPMSSTLECGFLTTGPPGTSQTVFIICFCLSLMHFLGFRSVMFYST